MEEKIQQHVEHSFSPCVKQMFMFHLMPTGGSVSSGECRRLSAGVAQGKRGKQKNKGRENTHSGRGMKVIMANKLEKFSVIVSRERPLTLS